MEERDAREGAVLTAVWEPRSLLTSNELVPHTQQESIICQPKQTHARTCIYTFMHAHKNKPKGLPGQKCTHT